MSTLVVDPLTIPLKYANNSTSNPKRLRILAQVVEYLDFSSILVTKMVPSLKNANSIPFNIDVSAIVSDLVTEITITGSVLLIEGFYDGSFTAFDIYPINPNDLMDPSAADTLLQMATING